MIQTDRLKPPSGLPHREPPSARLTGIFRGAGLRPPSGPSSGGSGSGAPHSPPRLGVILGPPQTVQIRPPKGEFFRFFGGLWCNAQGGWGGSAHYPDPTAQSDQVAEPRRRPRHTHGQVGPQAQYRGLHSMPGVFHALAVPAGFSTQLAARGPSGGRQGTEEAVAISTKRSG